MRCWIYYVHLPPLVCKNCSQYEVFSTEYTVSIKVCHLVLPGDDNKEEEVYLWFAEERLSTFCNNVFC